MSHDRQIKRIITTTPKVTLTDAVQSLEMIIAAMERAEEVVNAAEVKHQLRFREQMKNVIGQPQLPLNEPYLPNLLAEFQLTFVEQMETLFESILLFTPITTLEAKKINPTGPITPQVEEEVDSAIEQLQRKVNQTLDEQRQQAMGFTHYIWHTVGDDKVRSSHAANDGEMFSWNNPPGTGHPGTAPNCRCTAEPVNIDRKKPEAFALAGLDKIAVAIIIAKIGQLILKNKEKLDKVKKLPKPKKRPKKPKEKPKEKPRKIPKDQLNEKQKGARKTKISQLSNGNKVYQSDVPAKNILGSFARYEKTVDASGRTIKYTKTTYGPDGKIISVKDKLRIEP